MVPSLLRHRDKDICAGGTANAVANWGEEAAGGEGGEFTISRTRVLASKSKEWDQSDPHVAELSTQQQKPKYVREICSTYFEKK
jgi:hypothetical protein